MFFVQFATFPQREGYVLTHGQRIEECAVLKDHGDFFANQLHLRLGVIGDVFVGDNHPPGIRLQESHDAVQGNRLAHAAAAQNAHRLARQHVETHIVEHYMRAKRLKHIAEFDVGLRAVSAKLPLRRRRCAVIMLDFSGARVGHG